MSIFKDIVNKLLHRGQSTTAQSSPGSGAGAPGGAGSPAATSAATAGQAPQAPPAPSAVTSPGQQALSQVDVEAVMVKAASEAGQPLNWRTSIVDTLKALGVDSSLENRKSLAAELHYAGDTNDSAAMNTWLHKRVMQELAANGGKLPKDLTD